MSRHRLVLAVWAMLTLGLLVRAFANGLVGDQRPAGVTWRSHLVDVNRAGMAELTVLPGIGRGRAEAIVVERIRHGPFRDLADLERVDGLGPSTTGAFRGMVVFTVPGPATRDD